MAYRHVIEAVKNLWGIRYEDEFPLLHLAILLVLGTRHSAYGRSGPYARAVYVKSVAIGSTPISTDLTYTSGQ